MGYFSMVVYKSNVRVLIMILQISILFLCLMICQILHEIYLLLLVYKSIHITTK